MTENDVADDAGVERSRISSSVKQFVRNHVQETENPNEVVSLSELWVVYDRYYGNIAKRYFKWHLIQALPDGVERDLDDFYGIKVVDDD